MKRDAAATAHATLARFFGVEVVVAGHARDDLAVFGDAQPF